MTTPVLAFGILGPMQVTKGGRALALGGTKQRALLAALLLERDRVVARDRLLDALWGEQPPASAANSVHIYVSKLRRLLDDGAGGNSVLRTEPPGYLLCVPASAVDATEFERLLAEGKQALAAGAWAEAKIVLAGALALWRGPALADLAFERYFQPNITRLEDLRLEALTDRVEALLGLEQHAQALAELGTLLVEHPLEERLRALLMVAFYRTGRQQEALETYRAFRDRLAEDLGLEPTPELRKLEQAILRQDPTLGPVAPLAPRLGAALRTLPSTRVGTGIPIPSTRIVGRAHELAETAKLLAEHRLVTLTGAGGSGKTRLALELATAVAGRFSDGVFWVPLQALHDPALVESAIASAVRADGPLPEHIGNKQMLLLLDNFEQVVAAAPTVSGLVAQTPHARFLVTSRQPLDIEREQRYEVEPLPEADAVVLFCQRASSVLPGFRPTPAVEEICRRLDGLPLAVELAAARVVLLDPDELLARLEPRLPLLASRARDVPDRQRTLRATLDWSYELLSPEEQQLFRRLGVFRGGFSVEAAEAVCAADLDSLESLVAKSLLRRPGRGRPVLLDTIREYALERLEESAEAGDVHRRHAEFFLEVAESANLNAAEGGARLDVANADQDNIRAALAWSLAKRDAPLGLALATAMDGFWVAHDPREGMRWFGEFLGLPEAEAASPEVRAHALRAYGGATDIEGDDPAARALYQQSFELFEQLGDKRGMATLLIRLAVQELRQGEVERARELVERSREMLDRSGDSWGQAMVTGLLGAVARDSGDAERAYELIAESAERGAEAGVPWWKGGMLAELAALALNAGRVDEAETRARESLVIADEIGDRPGRVFGVGLFAVIAAVRGQQERAKQLWEAAAHEDAVSPLGGWRRHRQDFEAAVERHLGERWRRHDQITRLRLDDAVMLALQQ